jgi:hypothetical protein
MSCDSAHRHESQGKTVNGRHSHFRRHYEKSRYDTDAHSWTTEGSGSSVASSGTFEFKSSRKCHIATLPHLNLPRVWMMTRSWCHTSQGPKSSPANFHMWSVSAECLQTVFHVVSVCQHNTSTQCFPCCQCGVYWSPFFPATNIFCTWNTWMAFIIDRQLGQCSCMVTMLWSTQSGVWILAGARDFSHLQNVQTSCGNQPALLQLVLGYFPWG